KYILTILVSLGALILLLGAFSAGVHVGERRIRHWLFNPHQNFRGGRSPFERPLFPAGHGVFGKILSVSGSILVVQGKDRVEQDVLVTTSTMIRVGREEGSLANIRVDGQAAVFGSPNDQGQIEARLIRLFPGR
ncbi:MAG: hypothetical protein Q8R07_05165, partial [Candidatus Uhrbacteria bacterium]|nr:hypothetical protein [Candidatus Uhrbacteria bacterium]